MTVKFTKGPWKVFDHEEIKGGYGIDAEGISIIIFGEDSNDECGIKGNTKEEAIANANLIAAAPELYEMVKMLIENINEAGDLFEDGKNEEAWEWILAANTMGNHVLKKARGEVK